MGKRWNYYHDADPDEDYYEYIERKKSEEASTKLAMLVLKSIFIVIRAIVVYSPLVYIGYIMAAKITSGEEITSYKNIGLTILFSYVLYAIIFFIKGLLISLKRRQNFIWVLLWFICVAIACLIPALLMQSLLEDFFHPSKRMLVTSQLLSWGGGILFGVYVYSRYKFAKNWAPKIIFWSYAIGFRLIGK